MARKKKWKNLSNDEEDSSDEEWEEPEPTTNVFEISALTTAAYEDSTHPLPTVTRSWISPDLIRFHSRKSAVSHAQTLIERDVLIDRILYGIGSNGVRLRPVKPTKKSALEAGYARFLRDGLWIVGQEELWIEKRRECYNRKLFGDGGDPAWRREGHAFLMRKVRYWNKRGKRKEVMGTVVGWISETDLDSGGKPGFVSNKTGKPACLFHVAFDDFERDFEEYELKDLWVEDGESSEEKLSGLVDGEKLGCDESGGELATNAAARDSTDVSNDVQITSALNNEPLALEKAESKSTEAVCRPEAGEDQSSSSLIRESSANAKMNHEALAPEKADSNNQFDAVVKPEDKDFLVRQDAPATLASALEEAAAKQTQSKHLEAVMKSDDADKSTSIKVTVKQSTGNADEDKLKTVTPNDSDASSHEEVTPVIKPNARPSYIQPLPPSTHYRLNPEQIEKCYAACIEHYDKVMYTVKAKSLHHELADGFDVMRERGKGRYDMELPQFDTEEYSFLTVQNAAWMPIIHKILGEDAILVHKGCFLSLPGSETQVYHQDGVHLHKKIQKPCHAVNVFIPLVDYDMNNGPTEFCLGSHYLGHENFIKEMVSW
jgi:hypothetical protein